VVFASDGSETNFEQVGKKAYGFAPVTDIKQLASLIGDLNHQSLTPGADGVYEFKQPGETVYITAKGGWVIWSDDRDTLKKVPADPSLVLGDLPKQYTAAARITAKNLPPAIRRMMLDQLEAGARMGLPPGDPDDAAYAARTAFGKLALQNFETVINDLDEVLMGLKLDQTSSTLRLDILITAVPGSQTARRLSAMKPMTSGFSGFLRPDAALALSEVRTLDDVELAQDKAGLAHLRAKAVKALDEGDLSKEQADVGKKLSGDVIDVLEKTLEARKLDLGAALLLKPRGSVIVAGALVADGDKLDKALRKLLAEIGKEEPDFAKSVKLDAETIDGVRFHTVTMPVSSESAAIALGDKIDVVLGFGADRLYAAVGQDAMAVLKETMAKSKAAAGKEAPPSQVSLAATPIAKFVAAAAADIPFGQMIAQMAGMVGGMLEKSAGKDHLTMTTTPTANGAQVRLEVEEGLLKLIGALSQMKGPGGPMPPGRRPVPAPAAPPGDKPSSF
jgi:hypothetical protein